MNKLILLITLLISAPLFAGSADAIIKGETSSKRTKIEVHVGDRVGLIRYLKWTVDGKSYEIKDAEGFPQTVIYDKENGVYVISLATDEKEFKLWMIPGSEKVIKETGSSYKSTFGAVIEASDPREKESWKLTPRITIGCRLNYEI